MAMIKLENLASGYTPVPILTEINWHIQVGEHWVVTGGMGSGKTTLLNTIAGKTRKLKGKIDYSFLKNPNSFDERRSAIQLVLFTDSTKLFNSVNTVHYYQQRYQAFDSDGHLTVENYLLDGGLNLSTALHKEFLDLMDLWPLLPLERIKLSSGQTRKLLLCKAFLQQPRFLLLDNPHMGLDNQSRQLFNDYLDRLVSHFDQQIILAGHFRSLPQCINRQLCLEEGTIKEQRKDQNLRTPPSTDRSKSPAQLTGYLQKPIQESFNIILKFDQIKIKYQDKTVIECLDWTVAQGDKWVVQGPNGSGKSTLISLIYGDHPQAYSNKITLFDRVRGTGESIWDIKEKVGFTSPELHSYFRYNHQAMDVVLSGLTDTLFMKNHHQISVDLALQLFEYFNMKDQMHRPFLTLSTGMQRLVFFMRALIKAPPVLLLDEPYQGLDRQSIYKCNELLNEILTPHHTLIFISHFPDEVPDVVNHIKILTVN